MLSVHDQDAASTPLPSHSDGQAEERGIVIAELDVRAGSSGVKPIKLFPAVCPIAQRLVCMTQELLYRKRLFFTHKPISACNDKGDQRNSFPRLRQSHTVWQSNAPSSAKSASITTKMV